MNILPSTIEKIQNASKLIDVISDFVDLKPQGADHYGKCPMCHKDGKGKGLKVSQRKDVYKCFSCDWGGKTAVSFLMDYKNKTYPEALKYLADKYNILIDEPPRPQKKAKQVSPKMKSFRDKQLELSGLSNEDQKAFVLVDEETKKYQLVDIYQSGTRNQYGQITSGDDMIIWYYDLEGKPVMYQKEGKSKFEHLFRVRWQNPDLHLDKHSKPIKYSSPSGSGTHLYIPEAVRKAYSAKQAQKRLFIQEGEKKADKACKHGIFSVGIMGIHNIASKQQLPQEFQLLIKALQIKEVIFVIDSDFDELSSKIEPGESADYRPNTFFKAVSYFRDYFKTFTNMNIYLETYFGHVIKNEKNDKGIDDLLNNTLSKKENELFEDINAALNEKNGTGKHIQFYKVSTLPDLKLREIWNLHSAEKFFEKHKETLKNVVEFKFNRIKWRYNPDDDKFQLAQPLLPDEQYWEVLEFKDNEGKVLKREYKFKYKRLITFLLNRGFCRIRMADGTFKFAYIENNTVKLVDSYYIKDYVVDLTEQIVKDEEIIDMLYRGGKMYLGPDMLSNMKYQNFDFETPNRFEQSIYFKNKFWKITNNGVTERNLSELEAFIWADKINNFEATLMSEPLVTVNKVADVLHKFNETDREYYEQFKDQYFVDFSKHGEISHFIKFIHNTSEFYWDKLVFDKNRKVVQDNRNQEEVFETNIHFLSKMCAIGFLLHRYNNKSDSKAVIGMDGKLSEVGASNGRTGKSILGFALSYVIPQTYIPGKAKNLTEDRFIFEEVSEKTCNIFVDDVRANVDFEFFFPFLGGRATIEKKAIGKYTLPDDTKPKLYITTNHAIKGDSDSFKDRQFIILFSDYYNASHKPIDDFGVQLFDEWDNTQWNLFYNFMALCVNFYLKYGIVKPPADRIETRRLRQEIGEGFMQWADEYYSVDENGTIKNLVNKPVSRQDLWNNFKEKNANEAKFYSPNLFKKKFKNWCLYWKFQFNPHKFDKQNKPGADDKSNGIEYFTVGNNGIIEDLDL